jgi:hypothetical protein
MLELVGIMTPQCRGKMGMLLTVKLDSDRVEAGERLRANSRNGFLIAAHEGESFCISS